ncbi:MAG: YhjD/YihY/BrkB family envelope integrity protein [Ktedonobacterales bacterium]
MEPEGLREKRAGGTTPHSGRTVSGTMERRWRTLKSFWIKISNDWVFNLAGVLAYNLLLSVFPILLLLLAITGFVLGGLSPGSQMRLRHIIGQAFPEGTATGLLYHVTVTLHHSAPLLLVLGLVLALVNGSNLFVVLENCLGIVFKLRGRHPIHQRAIALAMLLLYVVIIPIMLLSSIVPPALVRLLGIAAKNPAAALFVQAAGIGLSVVSALLLFGILYMVVPNRRVWPHEIWKGTLVATLLLLVYEVVFPLYEGAFLQPQNYGTTAGFAVVILIFFYYLAFILLLGAEINSWDAGQRETAGSVMAVLHEVQAHNTTRGAAGPTAGLPQEDLQHHLGAAAMQDEEAAILHERRDHRLDEQPPKFAESGVEAPGFRIESAGERRQVMAEMGTRVDRATIRAVGQVPGVRRLIANTVREARRAAQQLRATSGRPVTTRARDADEAESA